MATLYELTAEFQEFLQYASENEFDEESIETTKEMLMADIENKADGYGMVIRELEGQTETLKAEIDRLSKRKTVIDNNIKNMKNSLEMAMRALNQPKIKTTLFTFAIQKNPPSLVIPDANLVPEQFLIEQDPKIDTKAIKELLKTQELDFAYLESKESLRIK